MPDSPRRELHVDVTYAHSEQVLAAKSVTTLSLCDSELSCDRSDPGVVSQSASLRAATRASGGGWQAEGALWAGVASEKLAPTCACQVERQPRVFSLGGRKFFNWARHVQSGPCSCTGGKSCCCGERGFSVVGALSKASRQIVNPKDTSLKSLCDF